LLVAVNEVRALFVKSRVGLMATIALQV
jgi:hypothetical protein